MINQGFPLEIVNPRKKLSSLWLVPCAAVYLSGRPVPNNWYPPASGVDSLMRQFGNYNIKVRTPDHKNKIQETKSVFSVFFS